MRSSYTSLEAELHDAFWNEEETPELEWLDAILRDHPGRALEIGSGSGRLLLPLISKGHQVEGLESSSDMLQLCRQSARNSGSEVILHEGDMTSFSSIDPYHSLLVPAFTLQLANDPAAAIANFHQLLIPGGLLYLTVFIPFAEIDGELTENEWYPDHQMTLADGRKASLETRFRIEIEAQTLHREHHYRLTDGAKTKEHFSKQSVRWFTPIQLRTLLTNAGFIVENAVADFDEELHVDEDSQIITIVARKVTATSED
ncbi:class I SAM-dependent methyltransferase [Haloferula sp.]|uniref:class I SAM-dependent methyltransferase n=1 Tax=Haloferula sp. TaxID=2497595 RepID=UPI003C73F8CA